MRATQAFPAMPTVAPLRAWVAERHGPAVLAPIALVYAVAVAAGAAASPEPTPTWSALALGGAAAWLWFLTLRILDDLSDATADAVTHPDRLLQRGEVQPAALRALAAAAIVAQLASCLVIDGGVGPVTAAWVLIVAATAVVLAVDRVPALLARPMLARLLRVPCSALPLLWWGQLGAGASPLPEQVAAALLAFGISFVITFDVARKFGPASEDEVSWSRTLGRRGAVTLCASAAAALALSSVLLVAVSGGQR